MVVYDSLCESAVSILSLLTCNKNDLHITFRAGICNVWYWVYHTELLDIYQIYISNIHIKYTYQTNGCRSCTSIENSDMDSRCPHDGHLLSLGLITSLIGFSMIIRVIHAPHLPHSSSIDIELQ